MRTTHSQHSSLSVKALTCGLGLYQHTTPYSIGTLKGLTRLDLETPRLPSSTSSLKLPALASDVWLTSLEGSTKVLDGLPNVPLTPEENSVGTGRSSESESVESNSLTTGGGDSLSGRVGESESGDRELGALGQSLVVEDGTDGNDGLVTGWVGVLGLLDDSGEGERGSVDLQISVRS